MGIKKKLGLGVGAAALGLSLIGGGTFAYFNDTAKINNSFAAGTLDLAIKAKGTTPINFDLSNLKPGDKITRTFTLKNIGTLSIDKVLMGAATADNFVNGTNEAVTAGAKDNNQNQFLSQFQISMFKVDRETGALTSILNSNADFTLADLVNRNFSDVDSQYVVKDRSNLDTINLTPSALKAPNSPANYANGSLPAQPYAIDSDDVQMQITFVDNGNQNVYQGDSVQVHFNLEAIQEPGTTSDDQTGNGYIRSNALDNSSTMRTTPGTNAITDAVSDAGDR